MIQVISRKKIVKQVAVLFTLTVTVLIGFSAPITASSQSISKQDQSATYNKAYMIRGQTYRPMLSASGYSEKGMASWYGAESGHSTAMGTRFNPQALTAAHKTLPLPTKVRVTNLSNGRSVDVIVNDRGPFKEDRLIDLSHGAAKAIGLHEQGVAEVSVDYLENLARNP